MSIQGSNKSQGKLQEFGNMVMVMSKEKVSFPTNLLMRETVAKSWRLSVSV
jgi:hypothetical protein